MAYSLYEASIPMPTRGEPHVFKDGGDAVQQRLLEKEGVAFNDKGRFDLERFRWRD